MSPVGGASAAAGHKVFICYRREETAAHAGRLYDAMVARFGESNVFMDVDMPAGVDFIDRITDVVSGCLAVIVVMGPTWAEAVDRDGRRRIEDPADFVRLEIETALGHADVTPIPVLVSGARMPRNEELPPELRPIARRNALELSDARWRYDVGRLVDTLDGLLDPTPEPEPEASPPPSSPPGRMGPRLVLEGALAAGLASAAVRALRYRVVEPGADSSGETLAETLVQIGNTVLNRTLALAVVGAVIAILLSRRLGQVGAGSALRRGLLLGALAGAVGGLVWAVPVYGLDAKVEFEGKALIELAGLAVSGGFIGALVGQLWRPPRVRPAVLAGAGAGFLLQAIVVLSSWKNNQPPSEVVLSFGLGAAAIVGGALTALVVASRDS
jgi:hypothetical protein